MNANIYFLRPIMYCNKSLNTQGNMMFNYLEPVQRCISTAVTITMILHEQVFVKTETKPFKVGSGFTILTLIQKPENVYVDVYKVELTLDAEIWT